MATDSDKLQAVADYDKLREAAESLHQTGRKLRELQASLHQLDCGLNTVEDVLRQLAMKLDQEATAKHARQS